MTKYRKKPVVIEAIQYNNLNKAEIEAFVGKKLNQELESESSLFAGTGTPKFSLIIETPESNHKAMPNDYIIKGVQGEFYPYKPDIFEATYEPINTITSKKQSGEYLVDFQDKVRDYCDKQMISKKHMIWYLSLISKVWNKALEIGFMEGQKSVKNENK